MPALLRVLPTASPFRAGMLEGHSADEHLVTVLIDFYIISSLFNLSTIYYFSSTLRCKSIRSFIHVLMFF